MRRYTFLLTVLSLIAAPAVSGARFEPQGLLPGDAEGPPAACIGGGMGADVAHIAAVCDAVFGTT